MILGEFTNHSLQKRQCVYQNCWSFGIVDFLVLLLGLFGVKTVTVKEHSAHSGSICFLLRLMIYTRVNFLRCDQVCTSATLGLNRVKVLNIVDTFLVKVGLCFGMYAHLCIVQNWIVVTLQCIFFLGSLLSFSNKGSRAYFF